MSVTIIRGTIVSAPVLGKLDITEGGYLIAVDGRIEGVYPVLPGRFAPLRHSVQDFGDALILQAPADMHLHAPQYPMLGTGMDLPLLEWLNTYTFPTEAKFSDPDYARDIYRRLAWDLISHGTTRVAIFSSLHREGTLILMEELERAGIRGFAGKVNMDRNCGSLSEDTKTSMEETERWLDQCDFPHVKPILTPRFTPACSDELMAFLGRLARERNLPVQSHLSENRSEIAWVRELHPDCRRYWETYDKFGLWGNRTLMAHCVWSDKAERTALEQKGTVCVHCASSNQNLCSGVAPVRRLLSEGVRVFLGSDIAGGDRLSMFDVAANTVRASKMRHVMDGWKEPFLSGAEAWYLATSAPAAFFGDKPGFAAGNPLHALVLEDRYLSSPRPLSPAERLERCVFLRQREAVRAVWSDGRKVFSR